MEEKKIGIDREIAICFQIRKKKNTLRLEPIKVIEGFYNKTEDCFYDLLGHEYCHISDCESDIFDNVVFGGKIAIPKNLKKLGISLDEYKEAYLNEFKKYTFRLAWQDIIARDKETGKEFIYMDDLTEFKEDLQDVYLQFSERSSSGSNDAETKYIGIRNEEEKSETKEEIKNSNEDNLLLPKEIAAKLLEQIKGQDEAIMQIATTIYKKYKYPKSKKSNLLLIGPTGVGKTYIFEQLSKILDIPLAIFNITGTSQSGYKGKDLDEMLNQLIITAKGDLDKAQNGIIVIDEIDKIAYNDSNQGVIATEGVQNELLKIIEGTKIIFHDGTNSQGKLFDTSNILFVGTGAFQKLQEKKNNESSPTKNKIGFTSIIKEDKKEVDKITIDTEELAKFGIKKELIGRMPIVIELNPLTEKDLCEILSTDDSELTSNVKVFSEVGITITNLEEVKALIAKDALEKHIGARGLNATINKMFTKIYYEIFNNIGEYDSLTLGPNIINDNKDYQLSNSKKESKDLTKKLVP